MMCRHINSISFLDDYSIGSRALEVLVLSHIYVGKHLFNS